MSERRGLLPVIAIALASVVGISLVQPRMASDYHQVHRRDDVFLLPPPNQLRAMTLGYKAAATDILWAKLIIEYGVHWQERRPFPDVTRYIDGILALEPDFYPVYAFVDTIMLYPMPGVGATEAEVRTLRGYLERGTRERPYDPEVWVHYGQFLAFIAPQYLADAKEGERWRVDGAAAIARGVEIGADAQRSLAASTILGKAGEQQANVEFLQRAYAMTDDPAVREQLLLKLRLLKGDADSERAITFVDRELRSNYRFLTRGVGLLIGPRRGTITCAGPASYSRRGCARDWQAAIDEDR